jgi:hypothetical protein
MPAFRETTVWSDNSAVNHTYLLEGDKMVAYIRQGTEEPFWFKKPITFSRTGRKFQPVTPDPFENSLRVLAPQNTRVVEGSKGQSYIVNLDEMTCSCPGYTFRGQCKHVKELATA